MIWVRKFWFYFPVVMTIFLVVFLMLSYFFTILWHLIITDEDDKECHGIMWDNNSERKTARGRGIAYLLIFILIFFINIASIIQSAITDPGVVPMVRRNNKSVELGSKTFKCFQSKDGNL